MVHNHQASKAFGKLGIIASIDGVAIDASELNIYYKNGEGNMNGVRFGIRTGNTAWGIVEASPIGGPLKVS